VNLEGTFAYETRLLVYAIVGPHVREAAELGGRKSASARLSAAVPGLFQSDPSTCRKVDAYKDRIPEIQFSAEPAVCQQFFENGEKQGHVPGEHGGQRVREDAEG
jgi:hypothetical protein